MCIREPRGLHKKKAKLVFYNSSPEEDSDIEILDCDPLLSISAAPSDDTLSATTESEMDRDEISSNADELSSMSISNPVWQDEIRSSAQMRTMERHRTNTIPIQRRQ